MRPSDPRVLGRLRPARRPLAVVLAGGVASSLCVVAQAFALTAVVVAVVRGDDLRAPLLALAGAALGRALAGYAADVAAARAAAVVGAGLRDELASAVLAGRTAAMPEGEVAVLATRGVTAAEPYLTRYVPALVLAGVLPALTVVAMATQDLLSAAIVVATLPLVPVFGALVGLATRDRAESQWRAMASLSGHFVDVMKGLPTLVAFRRADAQASTIRTITHRYREATLRTLRIAFASSAVLELVATISVALVAVVVGVRLAAGHLDLGTALVVLLLAPEAYWPLRRVGAEFHAAAEGVATFEAVADLAGEADLADEAPAVPTSFAGPLRATGLTYTHPGRTTPTVAGLDLVVPPRSITAVTGPSGCGKSTLLALLAGVLEPDAGTVTGRGRVAWMPQRPVFLKGSVAANLRLGAPGADHATLWRALERVALAERVRSLGGLEADLGEDGRNLSAGERARLALARVVVAERPLVLLDEPTAHVDPITRQVLLDVVVELAARSTVVLVAHDPAVVAVADQVVVLTAPAAEPTAVPEPSVPSRGATRPPEPAGPTRPARFVLSTLLGVLASLCGVALTATAGWLIVQASTHPATLTLLVAIVGVRAFGLGRPVFRYAERLRSHDMALRMLADRRVEVYASVVPLTPGRLGKRRGDVLSSVVDDVDAVVDRELRVRLPLRTYLVVVVTAALVAGALLPAAGAAIAVTSLAGAALAYAVTRLGTRAPEAASVALRAELSTTMADAAHLADELRVWQAPEVVTDEVRDLAAGLGHCTRRAAGALALARAAVHVSGLAGVAAVAVPAADAVTRGDLSAPFAALLVLVPVALVDVALGLVEAGGLTGRVRAAEARLAALAATPPAVAGPATPVAPGPGHDLAVRDAAFGWDGHAVLRSVSLHLAPGARFGVVGPSGCGKSTLAAGLVRFIDPLAGEVSLAGRPLPDLALDDVRGAVGYVDDDPHVFATTLVENVRLARPGASDDDVLDALRRAHLGAWVRTLPDGLDTWLGDGHAQVSGGERARLGLARSLLLDQPVLVLDEPVAHLDAATARAVADDLLDVGEQRTVVWITHSPVGLDRMDDVLELGGCAQAADLTGLAHG